MSTKELINEIACLPVEERARVLDSILRTLNPPDKNIDRKWIEVAKRRLADVKAGRVKLIAGNQVFNKLRKRFS